MVRYSNAEGFLFGIVEEQRKNTKNGMPKIGKGENRMTDINDLHSPFVWWIFHITRWPIVVLRFRTWKATKNFKRTFGFDWRTASRHNGGEAYAEAKVEVFITLYILAMKLDSLISAENQLQVLERLTTRSGKKLHKDLLRAKKVFWHAVHLAKHCGFPDQYDTYSEYLENIATI